MSRTLYLNKHIREKMLLEFKGGLSMARVDDLFLQKPGTAEALIRDYMNAKPLDGQAGNPEPADSRVDGKKA